MLVGLTKVCPRVSAAATVGYQSLQQFYVWIEIPPNNSSNNPEGAFNIASSRKFLMRSAWIWSGKPWPNLLTRCARAIYHFMPWSMSQKSVLAVTPVIATAISSITTARAIATMTAVGIYQHQNTPIQGKQPGFRSCGRSGVSHLIAHSTWRKNGVAKAEIRKCCFPATAPDASPTRPALSTKR